jgi:hypothetical protein
VIIVDFTKYSEPDGIIKKQCHGYNNFFLANVDDIFSFLINYVFSHGMVETDDDDDDDDYVDRDNDDYVDRNDDDYVDGDNDDKFDDTTETPQ